MKTAAGKPWARPAAVFFDLDGTLADTAHDLVAPINAMRAERGLAPMPVAELRPFASAGARGLIGQGLGVTPESPRFDELREEFLARYERDIMVHTGLFVGMAEVLDALDAAGIRWGVISNKIERYVRVIIERLGLAERAVIAYGGDSAPRPKPHPDLLLQALVVTGLAAERCVYVGDDLRDIVAGRAAGMFTVAAAYGYCGGDEPPQDWQADAIVAAPPELQALFGLAASTTPGQK